LAALNLGKLALANSVSCASPGNCSAGGSYSDSSRIDQAFVADEKAGTWRTAKEVPGTAALNTGSAAVNSVSCGSAGNCSAGGGYRSAAGPFQAFVANEVNGAWHTALAVPGTVSIGSGPGSAVSSVSCTAAGYCGAGGYYEDTSGGQQAFVADEKHGTWQTALEVPGTGALNIAPFASVTSLSCTSAGNCSAGGYYSVAAGRFQVFVVSEKSGTWGTAHEVPGTAALNSGKVATITSVSCVSAGNCSAGGSYTDGSGETQAFVVSQKNGAWGTAQEVAAALNTGGNATISSVSCPSPGNCAAGGSYTSGSGRQQAFAITENSSTWQPAQEVAAALNTGGNATIKSVSCPSPGNCAAGGSYATGTTYQAFVLSERDGTWQPAQEIAAAVNTGGEAEVDSVSCASVGSCAAGGSFIGAAGTEAFVVTGSITQATSTGMSLSMAKVTYGHEQSERISVTVKAPYSGTPTGTVTVKAGSTTVCTITLTSGKGACTLTARELRPGTYHLIASYPANRDFLGSASAKKTLTVVN
jgi:hypothetical protein